MSQQLSFYKYHGTGNDFILIDNRSADIVLSTEQVRFLCDRHFGIGADGLMLLELAQGFDFRMVYYNSDGRESTMCGNGGRCISAFAKRLGLVNERVRFLAMDGTHEAVFTTSGQIELHMMDVEALRSYETYFELNTGSPHYVSYTEHLDDLDMKKEGALIRYSPRFRDEGINVNLVEAIDANNIRVRTYERGVEDETLSCGTGVTACSLVHVRHQHGAAQVKVQTPGGELIVRCEVVAQNQFRNIWLCGPAVEVFSGTIHLY